LPPKYLHAQTTISELYSSNSSFIPLKKPSHTWLLDHRSLLSVLDCRKQEQTKEEDSSKSMRLHSLQTILETSKNHKSIKPREPSHTQKSADTTSETKPSELFAETG